MNFFSGLDTAMVHALAAQRCLAATIWWIRVSELGSATFISGLALIIALVAAVRKRYAYAAGVLISVFGASAAALALKEIVRRARPPLAYQAYLESGYSFPSAHAALSAALYGFCIFLLWRFFPSRALRIAGSAALALLAAAISYSRLALGVHYFSDVAGGVLIGGAFAALGIAATRYLDQRSLRAENRL